MLVIDVLEDEAELQLREETQYKNFVTFIRPLISKVNLNISPLNQA